MAISANNHFAVLMGAPLLPEGYHFGAMQDTPNGLRVDVKFQGARIFEIAAEYNIRTDARQFAARAVEDKNPKKRVFNQSNKWVLFGDITTLLTAMITRHRIGVKQT